MNYSMTLTGGMNVRETPSPNGIWIQLLTTGSIVEGDELFKDAANRDWLKVLLIDGVQTTKAMYIATYTSNGTLITNPLPSVYPDFVYDASTESEWPIEVFHNDISIGVFNGVIRVVSKNPTLKLT